MIHRAWQLYALNLAIFGGLFSIWQIEPVPLSVFLCGWILWAVATFPLALWYRRGHEGLPMFELICLAYGFAYAVALYLTPNWIMIASRRVDLPWEFVEQSVLLAICGVTGAALLFYLTQRVTKDLGLQSFLLEVPVSARRTYIGACLTVGLAARAFSTLAESVDPSYGAILNATAGQLYIGLVVLAYDTFQGRRSQVALIAVAGFTTIIGLLGGMLEPAVLPLLLVLIVRWHVRSRFPWLLATGLALFFFVINPVKYEYRNLTWTAEGRVGPMDRIANWVEAAQTTYLYIKDPISFEEEDNVLRRSLQRIDLLHKLAYVKSLTPETVPFLRGESYRYMLITFIPRLVWPNKPRANEATDLVDYAYGFRFPEQESHGTNIGAGFVAEAYANYSWVGVIMIMAIQGIIFALLNRTLNTAGNLGGQAIYATVMMVFLNGIGTSAVVLFGNVVQFVIVSVLFLRVFCGSTPVPRRRSQLGPAQARSA
jgi:hypothetical protein